LIFYYLQKQKKNIGEGWMYTLSQRNASVIATLFAVDVMRLEKGV